jgi:hypothetical protein
VAEQHRGVGRAQDVAVVDRVGTERHRCDQRRHLRIRARRAGTLAELDCPVDERLDSEPRGERRREHDPGIHDQPLVVEAEADPIGRDNQRSIVHDVGDLLTRAAAAHFSRRKTLLRKSFQSSHRMDRWIQAKSKSKRSAARRSIRKPKSFTASPGFRTDILPREP